MEDILDDIDIDLDTNGSVMDDDQDAANLLALLMEL